MVQGLESIGQTRDRLRLEAFEEWVEGLQVSDSTRTRIQYRVRKLVRFGKPFRIVRRDRRICLVGSILCCFLLTVTLVVAFHPDSFKKKHARPSKLRAAGHYGCEFVSTRSHAA